MKLEKISIMAYSLRTYLYFLRVVPKIPHFFSKISAMNIDFLFEGGNSYSQYFL